MTIPEKIYRIRTELSLSQKEFADKIGVSQSSINYWENGNRTPKLKQINQLCHALNIDIACFLDDSFEVEDEEKGLYGEMRDFTDYLENAYSNSLKRYAETGVIDPILNDSDITEYHWSLLSSLFKKLNHTGEKEAIKRISELAQLPCYTEKELERSTAVHDHVVSFSAAPKAARNNYINEPGEIEKTYEDISSLKRPE